MYGRSLGRWCGPLGPHCVSVSSYQLYEVFPWCVEPDIVLCISIDGLLQRSADSMIGCNFKYWHDRKIWVRDSFKVIENGADGYIINNFILNIFIHHKW